MLARELIELLQQKLADHAPCEEVMGELHIHVDVFKCVDFGLMRYRGLSPDLGLEYTPDGCFLVIGQKEAWTDENSIAG